MPKSKTRTPEEWRKVIEDWKKSSLSKREYCRQKQINAANFHVWIKRLHPSLVNEQLRETAKKWELIIADWEKSGLGGYIYCRANNIGTDAFYEWRRRLRPCEQTRSEKALEKWEARIKEWQESGLDMATFCKQHKISDHFYEWVRKINPALYVEKSEKHIRKWKPIIEDWKKSGLKQGAYCLEKNLALKTFSKWERRFDSKGATQKPPKTKRKALPLPELSLKVPVMPCAPSPPSASKFSLSPLKVEIRFAQGHSLSLEGEFDCVKLTSFLTPLLRN